jgi:hypothetical protein
MPIAVLLGAGKAVGPRMTNGFVIGESDSALTGKTIASLRTLVGAAVADLIATFVLLSFWNHAKNWVRSANL